VVWCYCESCWNNTIQHVLENSISIAKNKSLVSLNETVLLLLQEKSSKGEEARSLITAHAVIRSHWEVIRCSLQRAKKRHAREGFFFFSEDSETRVLNAKNLLE